LKCPEPRYFRRKWKSKHGKKRFCWVVQWYTGYKGNGRRHAKQAGGFASKELARIHFKKHVLPALEAGYDSPKQYARANKSVKNAENLTVGKWFEQCIEDYKTHVAKGTLSRRRFQLRSGARFFGEKTLLADVTERDIRKYIDAPTLMGTIPRPDTKRGRFRHIEYAFKRAFERKLIPENPCQFIKVPRANKGRFRFLTLEECDKLLHACLQIPPKSLSEGSPVQLYALVCFALYTGARRGEILHLEWTDIHEELGRVSIQPKPHMDWNTKNGRRRTLGVNPHLFEVLREYRNDLRARFQKAKQRVEQLENWKQVRGKEGVIPARPDLLERYERAPSIDFLLSRARGVMESLKRQCTSNLVFPGPTGGPQEELPRGYRNAIKKAGLDGTGVNFHTLRHTYASHLVMHSVDLPTVKELLGHADIQTTMRYSHLAPSHVIQAGAKMPCLHGIKRANYVQGHEAKVVGLRHDL